MPLQLAFILNLTLQYITLQENTKQLYLISCNVMNLIVNVSTVILCINHIHNFKFLFIISCLSLMHFTYSLM